jgi:hypothetical protein
VPTPDAGINKPFDRTLKAFAEEAPLLFLRLLGFITEGEDVEIRTLRLETSPPVVLPDFVAIVTTAGGEQVIFHVEFLTYWEATAPRTIARYGGSLAWQYGLRVISVLLLVRPEGAPSEIPDVGCYDVFDTRLRHPFRVMRMWEIDPTPVLATGNIRLFPWVLLMQSTDEQIRQIAAILRQSPDQEAIGRFLMLSGARYDRNSWRALLERGENMNLIEFLRTESWVAQDRREAREEGFAEGKAEGKAIGQAEGKAAGQAAGEAKGVRHSLRQILRKRFPELEAAPEIEQISDPATLDALLELALESTSVEPLRTAIVDGVPKAN